jgi:hypothetical protein
VKERGGVKERERERKRERSMRWPGQCWVVKLVVCLKFFFVVLQIQFNSAKLKHHMFKVENGIVQAISSTSISFDNIAQGHRAESLRNITIKEFPPSGFV